MSTEDISVFYDYITEYIKSPIFRNEIKEFVDDNCGTFFGEDENSFQQYGLHKEFKLLIENHLEKMLSEIGASEELFLLVAKKGLESPEEKKYYEQLVTCDNYVYFKNMMIRRNLQLEEQAMQLMYDQNKLKGKTNNVNEDPAKWNDLQKIREATELECAIQMSLALEEEKAKLREMEDEDLMKAIELSKMNLNNDDTEEEISLFDPSTLVDKKKNSKINQDKNKIKINSDKTKMISKFSVIDNKNDKTSINEKIVENKNIKVPIVHKNLNPKKNDTKITSKIDKHIDMAYYGNPINLNTQISKEENKNYVDIVYDQTEKILFEPALLNLDTTSKTKITHQSIPNEFKSSSNIELISNLKEPTIAKLPESNQSSQILIENQLEIKDTKKDLSESPYEPESNKQKIYENPSVILNSDLNIVGHSSVTPSQNLIFSQKNIDDVPKQNTPDEKIEDNLIRENNNLPELTIKGNLNKIRATKTFEGDRSFLLQNPKIDYKDVKTKIENINQGNKEVLTNIEISNDELLKKFEELQIEKQEKLKEYREMLLKMKKERRQTEKEKNDPFDIDESKLSDEVRKRLQMRKQLAEQLKNKE